MLKQNESKLNIKRLTDAEISAAIRYLDPGSSDERLRVSDSSFLVICASLVFLLGLVVFTCLYYWVS